MRRLVLGYTEDDGEGGVQMPTPKELSKENKASLESLGYAVVPLDWPFRTSYWKKDGEELPNLPADPYSMHKFIQQGLSPLPPLSSTPVVEESPMEEEPVEPQVVPHPVTNATKVADKKKGKKE